MPVLCESAGICAVNEDVGEGHQPHAEIYIAEVVDDFNRIHSFVLLVGLLWGWLALRYIIADYFQK